MLSAFQDLNTTQRIWLVLLSISLIAGICVAVYFLFFNKKSSDNTSTDTNNPLPGPAVLDKNPGWVTDGKKLPFRVPTFYNIAVSDKTKTGPPGKTSAPVVNTKGHSPTIFFKPIATLPVNFSYVLNKSNNPSGPFSVVNGAILGPVNNDGNMSFTDITNYYTGPPKLILNNLKVEFVKNSDIPNKNAKLWPKYSFSYAFALIDSFIYDSIVGADQNLKNYVIDSPLAPIVLQFAGPMSDTIGIDSNSIPDESGYIQLAQSPLEFKIPDDSALVFYRTSNIKNTASLPPAITTSDVVLPINGDPIDSKFVLTLSNFENKVSIIFLDFFPLSMLPQSLPFANLPFVPDKSDKKVVPFNTDAYYKLDINSKNKINDSTTIKNN